MVTYDVYNLILYTCIHTTYTQDLEELVHSLQTVNDPLDGDEYSRRHNKKIEIMRKDGWIFEPSTTHSTSSSNTPTLTPGFTSQESHESMTSEVMTSEGVTSAPHYLDTSSPQDVIGKEARRFFEDYGLSDGVIVAYLPADLNEGLALWHMEHDDGDSEVKVFMRSRMCICVCMKSIFTVYALIIGILVCLTYNNITHSFM